MNNIDTSQGEPSHDHAEPRRLGVESVRRPRGGQSVRTGVRAGAILDKYDATAKNIIQSLGR